jgi:hypothetical protein
MDDKEVNMTSCALFAELQTLKHRAATAAQHEQKMPLISANWHCQVDNINAAV